jgi:predicted metalloprotease
MRWEGGRESENVEDRRGMPGGPVLVTGGLGTLAIILIAIFLGIDPQALLGPGGPLAPAPGGPGMQAPGPEGAPRPSGADDELKKFVSVVLADTEDVWNKLFQDMGRSYREPKLVLFTGQVQSACGFASAAVGPFYCPGDERVYLDLGFFNELSNRFRAPGEFAEAYVIAHEIGHHVQRLMGITDRVDRMRMRSGRGEANALSVRLELQADFLAGVWAHHAQQMRNILERGDIDAAIRAATAIGDDRLQYQAQGYVVPDSFTHGTSAQRVRWFTRGFETGDIAEGDTFNAEEL